MADSLQEEVTHLLLSRAMGSVFSFFPALYRGNREPADFAWTFQGTVFLFYCSETARSFEKAFNHNARQARKWLRDWDTGIPLKGENSAFKFELSKESVSSVICVSITRSFPGIFPRLIGRENRGGVTVAFINIPESEFKILMDFGCSPSDFIKFASYLSQDRRDGVIQSASDFIRRLSGTIDLPFKQLLATVSDARYVASRLAEAKFNSNLSPEMKENAGLTTVYELGIEAVLWLSNVFTGVKQQIDAVPLGGHGPRAGAAQIVLGDTEIFLAIGRSGADLSSVLEAPSGDHSMLIARIAATRSTAIIATLRPEERTTMIVGTPIPEMPLLNSALAEFRQAPSKPIHWSA